jgi:hypothetical protein
MVFFIATLDRFRVLDASTVKKHSAKQQTWEILMRHSAEVPNSALECV